MSRSWRRSCAITRGDRVGIFLPRCLDSAIAVYGILKAGGGCRTSCQQYRCGYDTEQQHHGEQRKIFLHFILQKC